METEFDYDFAKLEAEEKMEKALKAYASNISKIQTGRANPQILNVIKVDYFGTMTPITQIANVSVPEPRQLLIKPYDIAIVKDMAGAINSAKLGINAVNEGDKIRMTFPEVTTERRKQLVKSLTEYTENARIQIRSARQDINKSIKKAEMSEDMEKRLLEDVQKLTDHYIEEVNKITQGKETSLMTI